MATLAGLLDAAIRAKCPHISGVSIGRKDDKATWGLTFPAGLNQSVVDAETRNARTVIDRFDPGQATSFP